eukprot:m.99999 g.99999  ORF g.99999 m.99999 type:complete len:73 (+) comp13155_c0_seq3:76-294(+)
MYIKNAQKHKKKLDTHGMQRKESVVLIQNQAAEGMIIVEQVGAIAAVDDVDQLLRLLLHYENDQVLHVTGYR